MGRIRQRAAEGLLPGDRFTVTRTFSVADIQHFARITRDYNPVHFDEPYIRLRRFKAPISHGLLTASLLTEIGGQIGWLASGMNLRFRCPVYAGDSLTCEWTITEIDDGGRAKATVRITNSDGVVVLEADTTGVVPGEQEQARLVQMISEGDPTNGAAGEPCRLPRRVSTSSPPKDDHDESA